MKTKKYISKLFILGLCTLFASTLNSIAQDTLHFRNGKLIIGKVTEITAVLIKYKKAENITGPTYSELKNDISMIRYNNGVSEKFEYQVPVKTTPKKMETFIPTAKVYPEMRAFGTKYFYGNELIGNREMHSILLSLNDRKISNHINLAKKQAKGQYIGFGFFPCAIAALYIGGESSGGGFDDEVGAAAIMGALGVACFATSITLKSKRTKNEAAALKLYQLNY